jgi:hypothetical protein
MQYAIALKQVDFDSASFQFVDSIVYRNEANAIEALDRKRAVMPEQNFVILAQKNDSTPWKPHTP